MLDSTHRQLHALSPFPPHNTMYASQPAFANSGNRNGGAAEDLLICRRVGGSLNEYACAPAGFGIMQHSPVTQSHPVNYQLQQLQPLQPLDPSGQGVGNAGVMPTNGMAPLFNNHQLTPLEVGRSWNQAQQPNFNRNSGAVLNQAARSAPASSAQANIASFFGSLFSPPRKL